MEVKERRKGLALGCQIINIMTIIAALENGPNTLTSTTRARHRPPKKIWVRTSLERSQIVRE